MKTTNPLPLPVAFAVALAAMVVSQIVRLHQTSEAMWLAADYGGRLLSLAILFLTTREVAFKRESLRVAGYRVGLWTLGLVMLEVLTLRLRWDLAAAFAWTRLSAVPLLHGWLLLLDFTLGLALVALHEEIVFRRFVRALLAPRLGDGFAMVLASAALFAAYHWQFGVATIANAFVFGVLAMLIYKRAGTIAPLVIAHYLIDAVEQIRFL